MKNLRNVLLGAFLAIGLSTVSFAADTYVIDPVHSTIGFTVKHLTVSEVSGNFKTFLGSIILSSDHPETSSFEATLDTASINTQNEGRDKHLLSPDFFDAANHPSLSFKSTSVTADGISYNVTGNLTIKGVTKEITLPLTLSGPVKNPMSGDSVIGVSGKTTINRQDFGVKWNKQMDQGGFVVGNDVTITINLEAHLKK